MLSYASGAQNHPSTMRKKPKNDSMYLECYTETNGVITTTMSVVPGNREVRSQTRTWGAVIGMGLKRMFGGEPRWLMSHVTDSLMH
ncbi:hypothetical protein VM1G_11516 [Cytospora mali]|uniref:Uncharacterized protein n=1 Tax=Cytospora mali TaxID=578113 RepID=A0A194VTT1_CYTMA|nr:hypothetical protein VM1G_11516 [Valsa mali]